MGRRPGPGGRDHGRRGDLPDPGHRRGHDRASGAHLRCLGARRSGGFARRAGLRRARHAAPACRREVRLCARELRPQGRVRRGLGRARDLLRRDRGDRRRVRRLPGSPRGLGSTVRVRNGDRAHRRLHRGAPGRSPARSRGSEPGHRGQGPGARGGAGGRRRRWNRGWLDGKSCRRSDRRRALRGHGRGVPGGDLELLRLPRRSQDRRGDEGPRSRAAQGLSRRHRHGERALPAAERGVRPRPAVRADRCLDAGGR